MIEVIANDRMGRKGKHPWHARDVVVISILTVAVRVKCLPTDTVGDLKKLIAAQTGTIHQKIQLKKWYVFQPRTTTPLRADQQGIPSTRIM